jgi:hypothetical protein
MSLIRPFVAERLPLGGYDSIGARRMQRSQQGFQGLASKIRIEKRRDLAFGSPR